MALRALLTLSLLAVAASGRKADKAKEEKVTVVVAADLRSVQGLGATLRSVIATSSEATLRRLRLVVVTDLESKAAVTEFCECAVRGTPGQSALSVIGFDADRYMRNAPRKGSPGREDLAAAPDWSRFYLYKLLPGVPKVVWIDADVVLRRDVAELYDSALVGGDKVVAAVPRSVGMSFYVKLSHPIIRTRRPNFAKIRETFNAGVLVFSLQRWRRSNYTEEVEWWMRQNDRHDLYSFGTQGPMLLMFVESFERLDPRWNVHGLGTPRHKLPKKVVDMAFLLHWSGKRKPWDKKLQSTMKFAELWLTHQAPAECRKH
eukprot:TRINITY_DN14497_c0_g1_i1.p1 TRINITY_DN14497_c0_g1~~TRINITY_DN14497_c0_g1_i1.p1  ORF type:complete len:343 (+),score=113.15 TRINITY_DN14497_c0_g1_i1:79-1029(+)